MLIQSAFCNQLCFVYVVRLTIAEKGVSVHIGAHVFFLLFRRYIIFVQVIFANKERSYSKPRWQYALVSPRALS